MLYIDKEKLKKFGTKNRIWQGIPGIEITKRGRIFSTFYSGGSDEETGNYVVLLKSDDEINFSEPIAAVYKKIQDVLTNVYGLTPKEDYG